MSISESDPERKANGALQQGMTEFEYFHAINVIMYLLRK